MRYIKFILCLLFCSFSTSKIYAQTDKQIQDILYVFDVTPDELTDYVDLSNYDLVIPYVHVQSYYDNRNNSNHPYYKFYEKWFTYLASIQGLNTKIALDMRLQNFNYVQNDSVLSDFEADLSEIDSVESDSITAAINHVISELITATSNSGYNINDIFGGLYVFDEPFNLDLKLMDGQYKKISESASPYFLTTLGENHNKIIYDLYLNVLETLNLSYIDTQTWGSEGVKYYTWLSTKQLNKLDSLKLNRSTDKYDSYINFYNTKINSTNANANIYSPVETPYEMALDHYSFTDKNNNTVKLDNFLVFDYYSHANNDKIPYQNVVESFKDYSMGDIWSGNSTPTTGTTLGNINFGINKMKRLFDFLAVPGYTNDDLKIHIVGPIHIKHESWGAQTL